MGQGARLELAKLQALQHARDLQGQATASQQRRQDAQRQLQARGGGPVQAG